MARFTLTIEVNEDDQDNIYDLVGSVAENTGDTEDYVQDLVNKYIDGNTLTLQFDTEKDRCFILKTGKQGDNDWEKNRKPKLTAEQRHEKEAKDRATHLRMLQTQLDEATETFKAFPDKKCAAALNLIRFIEETRQELNGLKKFMEQDTSRKPILRVPPPNDIINEIFGDDDSDF